MRRAIVLAFLVLPVTACSSFDRTEIASCEQKLIRGLKSPSSYQRIETNIWDDEISLENLAGRNFGPDLLPHEKQLLDEIKARPIAIRHASIQYDADNSFGAAIRDAFYCNFIVIDGKLYSPSAAYDAKWSQHIDDIVADKASETVKNESYMVPQDPLAPDYDPFPGSGLELPPY